MAMMSKEAVQAAASEAGKALRALPKEAIKNVTGKVKENLEYHGPPIAAGALLARAGYDFAKKRWSLAAAEAAAGVEVFRRYRKRRENEMVESWQGFLPNIEAAGYQRGVKTAIEVIRQKAANGASFADIFGEPEPSTVSAAQSGESSSAAMVREDRENVPDDGDED